MRCARLAMRVLVLSAGCAPARTNPTELAPPTVQAEAVAFTRDDGLTVRAARLEASVGPDGGSTVEDVEVTLGRTRARASRGAGVAGGPWFLWGMVHAWVGEGVDGGVRDTGDVEVEAPRMRMDPRARTATLEGGVRVRRGDVVMEATRVVVTYDAGGHVSRADTEGPVTAHAAGSALTAAGGARLDLVRRTLEIPGHVRVVQGPVVLEGDGATVDLATGAMELHRVRGRIGVPGP